MKHIDAKYNQVKALLDKEDLTIKEACDRVGLSFATFVNRRTRENRFAKVSQKAPDKKKVIALIGTAEQLAEFLNYNRI